MRKNVTDKKKTSIANLIKPNKDRVFIKKIDRTTQTASGLYLGIDPAHAQLENVGVIVAVGDKIEDTVACKTGVRVAYDSIGEMDIKIEDNEYVVIQEKNIMCFFYDKEGKDA